MSNPQVNYRLKLAYNGTGFSGLAPNPGVRTVVGEIQKILNIWLDKEPDIVMSGRTDAGVHSAGQVINFLVQDFGVSADKLAGVINRRLNPEVVVIECDLVDLEFSARYDATGRNYRYSVDTSDLPSPFDGDICWNVPGEFDLSAMQEASAHLLGTHDFSSFCKKPKITDGKPPPTMCRRIDSAEWIDLGEGHLRFDISGSAFCHQMVRSIVGFLVSVGKGKRQAGEIVEVLKAKDRAAAEPPAPPHGLCLWSVDYGNK